MLENLRQRQPATWRPYDWESDDGSFGADIVILDGAYSARPQLADLFRGASCSTCRPTFGASTEDEWNRAGPARRTSTADALMPSIS